MPASTTESVLESLRAERDRANLGSGEYADHVHHDASLSRFIQFTNRPAVAESPTLAEVYSTLTRMPGRHRISSEQAKLFIGSLRERLSIVALTGNEYANALQASAALGIVAAALAMPFWRTARLKPVEKSCTPGTPVATPCAVRRFRRSCAHPEGGGTAGGESQHTSEV